MQTGLDGLRPDAEELRRIFYAHSLNRPCNQHEPESVRQAVDGPLQKLLDLALRHSAFRVRLSRHKRKGNDLGLRPVLVLDRLPIDGLAPAS